MPDTNKPCSQPGCGHLRSVHDLQHPDALYPCRVTRCPCAGYEPPLEEHEEPEADPRRLVIEIPEGFAVTVQLVPIETA